MCDPRTSKSAADETRRSQSDWTPTLVARLRAGDADAGELLTSLYRSAMIRFCWGYVRNLDDAEDAAQDVFVKVLKAQEVPDNFRSWLYRIARNHCLNLLRSRGRRRDRGVLPSGSRLGAEWTGPLTRLLKNEDHSRVAHLVSALPERLQETLRLRYAEGLARAEIAEVVDVPEPVVKSRLYEGMKRLREHTAILGDSRVG